MKTRHEVCSPETAATVARSAGSPGTVTARNLAPITGVVPTMGIAFIAQAFITVIIGGPSIIAGTVTSAGLLGGVSQLVTFATTPVVGDVALLFVAVVLLRVLPQGITGKFFRRSI